MAKQRATNQPITSEEPIKPEEQFRLDEADVAPPSARPIGAKTTVAGNNLRSYGARSARERRAGSSSGRRSPSARRGRSDSGMRLDVMNEMLEHPTREVSEAQLREEYGYVFADLRSMAITAGALIVGLIVLAQILPK